MSFNKYKKRNKELKLIIKQQRKLIKDLVKANKREFRMSMDYLNIVDRANNLLLTKEG